MREELIGRRLALASSVAGVILATAKILVGVQTHSSAVISDGLEAAGDVLCSMFVYVGLWLASKPPDAEHPYGHGRYETLAGLGVGGLLLLTGTGIVLHAWSNPGHHTAVPTLALYPLAGAFIVKIVLAVVKARVGKRIDSIGLQADAYHDLTDLVSTTIAATAVLLTMWNPQLLGGADRIGSFLIGIIVLFLSIQVVLQTVNSLLDTMPQPDKMAEVRAVAMTVPGAIGVEKCFARKTGLRYHVDLHLEVDPDLSVRASHDIAAAVRARVRDKLKWVADVLVHVEPSTALITKN